MDKEDRRMIEVGDYVRTINKGIKRIDTIFENKTVNKYGYEIGSEWDGKLYSTIKTTDILNHSKNIIDLIEVGDYVNGLIVQDIIKTDKKHILYVNGDYTSGGIQKNEIKSIVTKEQFAQMEYKVDEK